MSVAAENLSESPCVSICAIDAEGLCLGCGRTLDEIERWPDLNSNQRRELLSEIRSRGDVA